MSARTAFPDSLDPTTLWALRAVLVPMHPTIASAPDLKAITVFLASTATPERGGLPYLDAVLPAEDRLAATRVVRDLGALPPSFAPRGRRGWRTSTSRTGVPSTGGWSAAANTSSARRAARTPLICGRRASSTDRRPRIAQNAQ